MKRKKLTFGIDIDGTLTDPNYFIQHLNKHFKVNIDFNEMRVYNYRELYNVTEEEMRAFFTGEGKDTMFSAQLQESAKETVLELAESHNVHIITARNLEIHDRTRIWLDSVGLRSIELHSLGTPDKRQVAKELGCDFFFEDHPTASVQIADSGINVLLMDAPYNRDSIHENIVRVFDWKDIRTELKAKGVL